MALWLWRLAPPGPRQCFVQITIQTLRRITLDYIRLDSITLAPPRPCQCFVQITIRTSRREPRRPRLLSRHHAFKRLNPGDTLEHVLHVLNFSFCHCWTLWHMFGSSCDTPTLFSMFGSSIIRNASSRSHAKTGLFFTTPWESENHEKHCRVASKSPSPQGVVSAR